LHVRLLDGGRYSVGRSARVRGRREKPPSYKGGCARSWRLPGRPLLRPVALEHRVGQAGDVEFFTAARASRCSLKMSSGDLYSKSFSFPGGMRRAFLKNPLLSASRAALPRRGDSRAPRARWRRSELVTVPPAPPSSLRAAARRPVVAGFRVRQASSARRQIRRVRRLAHRVNIGIDCAGFVQAIQTALISPPGRSPRTLHCPSCGVEGLHRGPKAQSNFARSFSLQSRGARQPIGHAADFAAAHGVRLPVRLKGPAPGLPIWPVARCRLMSAQFSRCRSPTGSGPGNKRERGLSRGQTGAPLDDFLDRAVADLGGPLRDQWSAGIEFFEVPRVISYKDKSRKSSFRSTCSHRIEKSDVGAGLEARDARSAARA